MPTLDLRREDSVFVLTMANTEQGNMINAEIVEEFQAVLDEVEGTAGNAALVLTSSHPKIWNSGMDLAWITSQPTEYHERFASLLDRFLLRWALLNIPTVGCITGHAFGAGALLATTLDFRLMREDRGWIRFPAIDIKLTFTPVMHSILDLLPNRQALRDLLLTGKRIGGTEAEGLNIVDESCPVERLFSRAMELAEMLAAKDRQTYTTIKHGMRQDLVRLGNEVL